MRARLDIKHDLLCVVVDAKSPDPAGATANWYPVRSAEPAEAETLRGRPLTAIAGEEGIYVDEDGGVFRLKDGAETAPLAVERPAPEAARRSRSHARTLRHTAAAEKNSGSLIGRVSGSGDVAPVDADCAAGATVTPASPSRSLRGKLAEVRRRLGYVQKRGLNERHNYSYVTAADIAGAVGDLLAELGVVVLPRLEDISYEPAAGGRGDIARVARVVMAYTFTDVDSEEELTVKVAGQGLDFGDKAPYKALTGALKYALLQTFLLATGDDPEDERGVSNGTPPGFDQRSDKITPLQLRELRQLIEETGTDPARVLSYYKLDRFEDMSDVTYQRALGLLRLKRAAESGRGAVHAHD